jgi:hypothetical protein
MLISPLPQLQSLGQNLELIPASVEKFIHISTNSSVDPFSINGARYMKKLSI